MVSRQSVVLVYGMIMLTPTEATIKIRQDDGKISVYRKCR